MSIRCTLSLLAALAAGGPAFAHDRWENPIFNSTDDDSTTLNFLQHGAVQTRHDLDATGSASPDEDWFAVKVTMHHSYEARVNGGSAYWSETCTPAPCPRFDLVQSNGTVAVAGETQSDDVFISINRASSGNQNAGRGMTVRWLGNGTGVNFLRAKGDEFVLFSDNVFYDVSFRDTTYLAPRWNNSGTQVSILVLQNSNPRPVFTVVSFYDTAAAYVMGITFEIPAFGSNLVNMGTIPALQGKSGSLKVGHTGGYGSLAGKVVALEPATGFTFDTPIEPIPY